MSPAALYFASGESLYPGVVFLLLGVMAPERWPVLRSLSGWIGLILMVGACPPAPWWAYGIFVGIFLLWLFRPKKLSRAAATMMLAMGVFLVLGTELSQRKMPVIAGGTEHSLVIIGDSLSSGIGGPSWPTILEHSAGISIKNLSRPGAGVRDALAMAAQMTREDHLLLLEIGGNDLLGGIPSADFANGLEALQLKACAPRRTVVMFELPLIPSKIAYGYNQRRLARKYHVFLIPKRFFADVLRGPHATSDGLYLSEVGASRLPALVEQALSPVLQ